MKIKKVLFYLLAGILGGCGPVMSLHPLYTEKDLTFDEKLLGAWQDEDGETKWEFSRSDKSPKAYRLTFADKEQHKGLFDVHLVKLKEKLFLDVYPAEPPCDFTDPNKTDWPYNAFFLIPVHTFVRVDSIEPKLKFRLTDNEVTERLLKNDPNAVKSESLENGIVLTSSTEELQKFVLKYADNEEFFSNEILLVRKEAPDPNQPGKKAD